MLTLATKVVRDYGKVLAAADAGIYGIPESTLPYSKTQIREAIRHLLLRVDPANREVREGLIHGYVYLAQFIPDEQVELIAAGQSALTEISAASSDDQAKSATRMINRIKSDMEVALTEVQSLPLPIDVQS